MIFVTITSSSSLLARADAFICMFGRIFCTSMQFRLRTFQKWFAIIQNCHPAMTISESRIRHRLRHVSRVTSSQQKTRNQSCWDCHIRESIVCYVRAMAATREVQLLLSTTSNPLSASACVGDAMSATKTAGKSVSQSA